MSPGRESRSDRGRIMETLARAAGTVEPGVLRLEQEVLVAAMHDFAHARALAETLTEENFSDLRHREIVRALLAMLQAEQFAPADLVENFAEDDPIRERAIELLVSDTVWTEEEFFEAIEKMGQARATRGLRLKYEVKPAAGVAAEATEDDGEEFEAWRRTVATAIDSGELSPDDPDFIKFMKLGRRFQGTGSQGFSEHTGLTSFSAVRPAEAESRVEPMPEHTGAADEPLADPDERS